MKEKLFSVSDTNINLNKDFSNTDSLDINEEEKTIKLYKLLQNKIFTTGTTLIKTPPTKINVNKENTYIDHIFSNVPQKISSQKIIRNGYSDHFLIQFIRKSKNLKSHPSYTVTRNYNLINWDQMRESISTDTRILDATLSHVPDEISNLLIQSISDHLEEQAPLVRKQIQTKIPKFTSQETKDAIKERDQALVQLKRTNDMDDIRGYKTKRNLVHKLISRDKKNSITDKIQQITKNDSKSQWKEMKSAIENNNDKNKTNIFNRNRLYFHENPEGNFQVN